MQVLGDDDSVTFSQRLQALVDDALERKGVSARKASFDVVGNDGLIRDIRAGRIPSAERIEALFKYLGLEFYLGTRRASGGPPVNWGETLPHHGLAKCSVQGWGKDQPNLAPLPGPEFINDPRAFYVSASGQSMMPEGINSGDYCLVSPVQDIKVGDRVWIKDRYTGATAIKRLAKMDGQALHLRGWMPIKDGQQQSFDEVRYTDHIEIAHPVVAVFRGKPGTENVRFIQDPSSPDAELVHTLDDDDFALISLHDIQVAAGTGRQNWEGGAVSALAFPRPWLRKMGISPQNASLVYVAGDSMAPTLVDGAMVLINQKRREIRGRRIYAFRQGDDLRVKRLEVVGDAQILITSDNTSHPAELLALDDGIDLDVIGEVVWSGHTL